VHGCFTDNDRRPSASYSSSSLLAHIHHACHGTPPCAISINPDLIFADLRAGRLQTGHFWMLVDYADLTPLSPTTLSLHIESSVVCLLDGMTDNSCNVEKILNIIHSRNTKCFPL